jgi:hypothetical protein
LNIRGCNWDIFLKGKCFKGKVLVWKDKIIEMGRKYQEVDEKRPPAQFSEV